MAEKLLEVQNLRTHFFTRSGVVKAVEDVSFYVDEAETLGIVGESGSGKSVTSLSVMRLIDRPGKIVGGKILFRGEDILDVDEDRLYELRGGKIAMIFQDPMTSLNPVLTVGFQIAEAVKAHLKLDDRAAMNRAAEMLERVRIPDARRRLDHYPHEFSGGMRQRVMIAIALAANPKLLIADEPTTALDVTIQAQILELIQRLRKDQNTSVMFITHDLGVVAGLADRILVMYAGHIAESSPTEELFANPRHPYTLGLLGSVPRLDAEPGSELTTIPGSPPDLLHPPKGCPFQPRCPFRIDKCQTFPPDMVVGPLHTAACWVDVTDPNEQARAMRHGFIPLRPVSGTLFGETVRASAE